MKNGPAKGLTLEAYLESDAHKQFLLTEARHYQTMFWRTLKTLEDALHVEINSTADLQLETVETLLTSMTHAEHEAFTDQKMKIVGIL